MKLPQNEKKRLYREEGLEEGLAKGLAQGRKEMQQKMQKTIDDLNSQIEILEIKFAYL